MHWVQLFVFGGFFFVMGTLFGMKVQNWVSKKYFALVYFRLHNFLKKREGITTSQIDFDYFKKIVDGTEK